MVNYIAYLPDKLLMNTPIKVYNVLSKSEFVVTFQDLLRKYPPPPPCSMWGTPTGHFYHYSADLKWTHSLNEYNSLKQKNILYQFFSRL